LHDKKSINYGALTRRYDIGMIRLLLCIADRMIQVDI